MHNGINKRDCRSSSSDSHQGKELQNMHTRAPSKLCCVCNISVMYTDGQQVVDAGRHPASCDVTQGPPLL